MKCQAVVKCLGHYLFVMFLAVAIFQTYSQPVWAQPVWQAQGPSPMVESLGVTLPLQKNPVVGAIQVVLPHPTHNNTIYVGTVNGGIWKTSNGGTDWTPLTDRQPSLSIGALAMDVANPNRLVAGFAVFSNARGDGGPRFGLIGSNDAGASWRPLGSPFLQDTDVGALLVNQDTIWVAARDWLAGGEGLSGLFLSQDGGRSFQPVSGHGTLPNGGVTSLAWDPRNDNRVYAGVTKQGIYRSSDGGQTWTRISIPGMKIDTKTATILLSVGAGGRSLFAAIAKTDPDQPAEKGPKERLDSVWRSLDGGKTWQNLGYRVGKKEVGLPGSTEKYGFFGVNPGGQADINLSLLADPTNPNLVYIGGDTQPGATEGNDKDKSPPFPNSIGSRGYTGRLFRGNASQPLGRQWIPITDNFTNPKTGPHADSRWLAFDAAGKLLQVDDGGIYRQTAANTSRGTWQSINGNLQITEFYPNNIAFNRLTKTLWGGNQDNGVAAQQQANGRIWEAVWSGDGGRVAINDANKTFAVVYGSSQELGNFGACKLDPKNNVLAFEFIKLMVGKIALEDYEKAIGSQGLFITPMVLNQADKTRLAFGTQRLYLAQDKVGQHQPISTSLQLTDITNKNFSEEVGALAYGRPGNSRVLLVGEGPRLWLSTTSGIGSLKQLTTYQSTPLPDGANAPVKNVFLNPRINPGEKEILYVSDGYTLQTSVDGGSNWGRSISLPQLTSLQFITAGGKDAVVAGGYGTLYASRDTDMVNWVVLAGNLPGTLMAGLDYSHADDLLVVGTMGWGAFTLPKASSLIPEKAPVSVNTGWLRLLDAASAAPTLNGGTVQFVDSLTFTRSLTLTSLGGTVDSFHFDCRQSGRISGPGALIKTGTGMLTLSGANTYGGGTSFNQGTVNITRNVNLGAAGSGLTWGGGTLQFGATMEMNRPLGVEAEGGTLDIQNFDVTLKGTLGGTGLLLLQGDGRIYYGGNGSDFNGALMTHPDNLDQQFTLGRGGKLSGSLWLANVVNEGEVDPGDSPGTMTVRGRYTQTATGNFLAEIASPTSYDRIQVSGTPGTATLAGTVAPTLLAGYRPHGNQVFPGILTATGSVTGMFNTITNPQITPTLSWQTRYHPNRVDLSVARSYTGANLGLSANQQAVGAMLNRLTGVTGGDLNQVLNTIDYLSVAGVQDALKEISPEKSVALSNLALTGASFQMHNQAQRLTDLRFTRRAAALGSGGLAGVNPFGSSQFSGLLLAFNSPSLSGLITQPQAHTPWGVYLYPTVIIGNQGSTANQTGYNFTMAGFTLGADYRLQDNLIVGLATGYSYTNANFKGTGGGVQANAWPLTVYGAYLGESFYAYGSVGYVLNLFNQERHIQFGGLKRTADSSPTGNQLNAYAEAGYDLNLKPFIVTPVASLACSSLWLGGYSETGAGALNLAVASQNATSVQTGIGLKIAAPFQTARATIVPQVYATYQHEFANNSRGLDASLSQGGSTFTFTTDAPQRDFALVGAKVDLLTGKNLQLTLNYNAEVGRSNSLAQSVYTGVRWQF